MIADREATEAARAEAERVLANANAALADASRKSAGRTREVRNSPRKRQSRRSRRSPRAQSLSHDNVASAIRTASDIGGRPAPNCEQCCAAWDRETSSDQKLETMIALADEWLKLCARSRSVNRRLPSSFGLSKICSRWHDGKRVLNGPFLMCLPSGRLRDGSAAAEVRRENRTRRCQCLDKYRRMAQQAAQSRRRRVCFTIGGCAGPR